METSVNDQIADSSPRRTTTTSIAEVTEEVVEEEPHPSSEQEEAATPTTHFSERKRSLFSYDANELRRRTATSSSTSKTVSSGTTSQQHSSTSTSSTTIGGGDTGFYECNICFDTATYPVLTLCGHLFCWSCLAQWLNAQSRNPTCPVCKAGCGKDKVIPIYGRGKEEKDPRNDPSIPTRPAGQRPPPLRDPNRPGTSFFGQNARGGATYNSRNVTFSGGIGLFPFGISFNFPVNGSPTTDFQSQAHQNAFMSRLFLMVLSLVIVAIIFY
ncbi:hypothetical protein [Absidia glauca]|uniref:RING-type E3 ubiquitin transferase n=1 Tax=Absidia glauca TaxID=4829 RepID=A0A168NJD9_ABSGL|nr:hypothetical protein [Absidia glauca]